MADTLAAPGGLDPTSGCPSGLAPSAGPVGALGQFGVSDPSAFVRAGADGSVLELLVRGAKCAGCIAKIEGGLGRLDGVVSARLNLSTGKLRIAFDADRIPPRQLTATLAALGYGASPFAPETARLAEDDEGRELLRALAIAGFAAANVMLLSVSVWAGAGADGEMTAATRDIFHWISGAIAAPAVVFAGQPFFRSAWRALRVGRANMDVPISLAVTLALIWSFVETARGGEEAYFDASVMLLFFLLIGRWLDHALRRRSRAAARDLLSLQATTATRLREDGDMRSVAAHDLTPGDLIVLRAGERAPVDGVVEAGEADVDMALATGESAPVAVAAGAQLVSGVMALNGALHVRVTARAEDSFLADLARLVEAGEQGRSRYVRLADRAAALYVPFVHSAAFLTFLGWYLIGGDLRPALMNAITLLIITCPCALGLAAPAVQVVATGRLFRLGVLVKSGDALERLAQVEHAVFDKTGTLTTGRFSLAGPIAPDALAAAAPLARASAHPAARAVAAAAGPGPVGLVRETPGCGVELVSLNTQSTTAPPSARSGAEAGARLGSAAFVGAAATDDRGGIDEGGMESEVWFRASPASQPVRFPLVSQTRPGAAHALRALEARGVSSEMLTGDLAAPARALAERLDLRDWRAGVSPQGKAERLDALKSAGLRVLMVGDGLNDAPALARAHVSLSPGTAVEASQNAADIVFQGEDLSVVADCVDVARSARRRILENFAFAALYNVCAVPIAAAGLVTPLVAAIAMSSSSLIVTLNALRVSRAAQTERRVG